MVENFFLKLTGYIALLGALLILLGVILGFYAASSRKHDQMIAEQKRLNDLDRSQ